KCLHHFLLLLGGLGHHVVVLYFRRGQMELIGGLDIGNFPEQVHQLGKIEELAESRSRSISSSFWGKLQSRDCLPKPAGACPRRNWISSENEIQQVLQSS